MIFMIRRSHCNERVAPAWLQGAHHRGDGQRAARGCGALRGARCKRGGGQTVAVQCCPAGHEALQRRHRATGQQKSIDGCFGQPPYARASRIRRRDRGVSGSRQTLVWMIQKGDPEARIRKFKEGAVIYNFPMESEHSRCLDTVI